MRLGGPIFAPAADPAAWVAAHRAEGYTAAFCPLGPDADDAAVAAYERAAREAGIVIAEVGAWSNPMSPDEATRKAAIENCKRQLHLADRIGARCCVNIAGSLGAQWDGPHPANLTRPAFDQIVQTVRGIIDAVHPSRSFYTLETMPWMYPDSPESYADLIKAIDRRAFAVHLDPVNLVCSPQRYFGNADLLRACFKKLGPHIRSCHAKDIILRSNLTTHLDEVVPGQGGLDYGVYLTELSKLAPDIPLMMEHMAKPEEYRAAAAHIRKVAAEKGLGAL
ncbi:MAG: sugar phosphate isomerase/epimerase [Armatimonadetes bacterium]|nr:sugar phosphate isomerase/epimerase [Armatimonadota bacterium]